MYDCTQDSTFEFKIVLSFINHDSVFRSYDCTFYDWNVLSS